jgi:hypothetical protein
VTPIDLLLRLVNGLVTLYFAPSLYRIYNNTQRRFYLYWALGYFFYGLSIIIRLFTPEGFEVSIGGIVAFFFIMVGFVFMVVGVGELIERRRLMLTSALIILLPVLQYLFGTVLIPISMAFAILPYLFMALSLIIITWRWNVDLRLLSAGWAILFMVNLGFFLNTIKPGFVDLLSTLSKIIIYSGMTQSNFSFIVDDLRTFLLGGMPTEYTQRNMGTFNLINLKNTTREKEIHWINERVEKNSKTGIRTILITLYDLITSSDIMNYEENEDLYIVRILPGTRSIIKTFEERNMSINDDLNQLDLLFSDIFNFSTERKVPCEIVLISFSHLIHTHGWRRIYSFITTKIPLLKASQVTLSCFYYPDSHEKESDIVVFEKLADSIIIQ